MSKSSTSGSSKDSNKYLSNSDLLSTLFSFAKCCNASLSDRIKNYNNRFKQHLVDEDSVESKSKLDRYLLKSFEDLDMEDFNILMWWKMNSSRYRVIFQIARDVLAIPISTVASKSTFSTGGEGGVFWIRSIAHYLLIQLKPLFVPKIGWRMQRKEDH